MFKRIKWKWKIKSNHKKIRCYRQLVNWMIDLHYNNQKILIESITKTSTRKQYPELCLTWDEINTLDCNKLVTIGAHTHSHPVLSRENKETVRQEIIRSKLLLEKYLEHSVIHLA